jgi:hypothetical protein
MYVYTNYSNQVIVCLFLKSDTDRTSKTGNKVHMRAVCICVCALIRNILTFKIVTFENETGRYHNNTLIS